VNDDNGNDEVDYYTSTLLHWIIQQASISFSSILWNNNRRKAKDSFESIIEEVVYISLLTWAIVLWFWSWCNLKLDFLLVVNTPGLTVVWSLFTLLCTLEISFLKTFQKEECQ